MDKRFLYYFKIVAAVHIVVITAFTVFSGCTGLFKKKEEKTIAVKFMVAVAASSGESVSETENVPPPIPSPVPPPPVPVPSPTPTKPKEKLKGVDDIKISKEKIKRSSDQKEPEQLLSDEQIKQLLLEGADIGDKNILPGEEDRCRAKVRKVLHDAWAQPSLDEAGGVVAEVKISLWSDGRISGRSLVKKSGNSILDASVMRAVNSVSKINGLSRAFIKKNSPITVSFQVQ